MELRGLKALPKEERPREKARRYGMAALSDAEVLALLLGTGSRGESVLETAERLLEEEGGLLGLSRKAKGVGLSRHGVQGAKGLRVAAGFELARRVEERHYERIRRPTSSDFWRRYRGEWKEERLLVLLLDRFGEVKKERLLGLGSSIILSLNFLLELVREGKQPGCLLIHNHPQGLYFPSSADLESTARLALACKKERCRLLDHLVISPQGYFSFAAEGLL